MSIDLDHSRQACLLPFVSFHPVLENQTIYLFLLPYPPDFSAWYLHRFCPREDYNPVAQDP